MTDRLRMPPISPRQPLRGPEPRRQVPGRGQVAPHNSFQSVLDAQVQETKLKFSRHAEARMNLRNVQLDGMQLTKLEDAVKLAKSKGAKESLIIMEGNVFVVSVKNNTVITVVDRDSAKENVFTQIDSAVLTD